METPRVSFEFTREWVHAGVSYCAGDRIDLPEAKAEELRSLGAGEIVSKPEAHWLPPRPSKRKR
jgi:hypothetical protein